MVSIGRLRRPIPVATPHLAARPHTPRCPPPGDDGREDGGMRSLSPEKKWERVTNRPSHERRRTHTPSLGVAALQAVAHRLGRTVSRGCSTGIDRRSRSIDTMVALSFDGGRSTSHAS